MKVRLLAWQKPESNVGSTSCDQCFDRILWNGCVQSFLDGARAQGFFWTYRRVYPVSHDLWREVSTQYPNWVKNRSQKWGAAMVEAPEEQRRDDFVKPYFPRAKPDQVVVILKAREPAGIMTATGNKKENKWHLETKLRWVDPYNFYLNDAGWGPMLLRVCPTSGWRSGWRRPRSASS